MVEPKAEETANSIIAEALGKAGVPSQNIEVPSEEVKQPVGAVPSSDGEPKAVVKGANLEVEEEPETSKDGTPKPDEVKPELELLSKAETIAAINEASSKFQSMMDGKINQLQYQMTQTTTALNQFFQNQEDTSISSLPAEEQVQARLKRLESPVAPKIQIQAAQPINQQATQYYQQLTNFVDTVGLKIDDKRIDWAPDVTDPKTGYNRFFASIKKALVEDQTKVIQELKNNGDKVLSKIRKKTGVDKVSTSGPSGAGLPDMSKMTPMQKIELGYAQQEQLSQINQ